VSSKAATCTEGTLRGNRDREPSRCRHSGDNDRGGRFVSSPSYLLEVEILLIDIDRTSVIGFLRPDFRPGRNAARQRVTRVSDAKKPVSRDELTSPGGSNIGKALEPKSRQKSGSASRFVHSDQEVTGPFESTHSKASANSRVKQYAS